MNARVSLAALLVAFAPSIVAAQDLSGGVTLGFGKSDISDVSQDITTKTLDGRIDATFGNGFTLGANINAVNGELDGVAGDVTGTVFGADVGYRFSSGYNLGLYAALLHKSREGFIS